MTYRPHFVRRNRQLKERARGRATIAIGLAIAFLTSCESKNESPFESHGMRAGMGFVDLTHRTAARGTDWKRTPFMTSVIGVERTFQPSADNPRTVRITAIVDTTDNRVLEIQYTPVFEPTDTAAVSAELNALAAKWDKITSGVRDQNGQGRAPYFIRWQSPDSVWTGKIFYNSPPSGGGRPESFESSDRNWESRAGLHVN